MATISHLQRLLNQHASSVDAATTAFEADLRRVVNDAMALLLGDLHERLDITPEGQIAATAKNARVLRKLQALLYEELDRAGLQTVIDAFAAKLPGQVPAFDDILRTLAQESGVTLPKIDWTKADRSTWEAFQMNTMTALDSEIQAGLSGIVNRTILSFGGLKFRELVDFVKLRFDTSIARATQVSHDAQMAFYRNVSNASFQRIEANLPKQTMRYFYAGPDDDVTSEICETWLHHEPFTRAEIDMLVPIYYPPGTAWTFGGHPRCRHQFLLFLDKLAA